MRRVVHEERVRNKLGDTVQRCDHQFFRARFARKPKRFENFARAVTCLIRPDQFERPEGALAEWRGLLGFTGSKDCVESGGNEH